jgi:rhodanese-related sulfurtransferase
MDNDDDEIKIPEVTALQLKEQLEGPNPPYLLDVREGWEVAQGTLPNAVHIPMNSVPGRISEIPQDQPVVVYCAHGSRSYSVTAFLIENGFNNITNLEGGIHDWAAVQAQKKP